MSFETLLNTEKYILSQGSVFELLRRSPEVVFDNDIFHAGLIYDEHFSKVLEGVYRSYIETAVDSGFAMTIGTATWRANKERIRASAFSNHAVNEDNVQFLKDIRASYSNADIPIFIEGEIGPSGDAYKPQEALDEDAAYSFHAPQIQALASSGVDFLQASTFPALSEGLGVARSMAETGLPYVISFIVDKSSHLLDGTKLSHAIARIDDAVGTHPAKFGINCVHPKILHQALDENPGIKGRIISFHGNTSHLSAAELDGSDELITEEPAAFAHAYKELLNDHDIKIIGGCCGSNPDHIRAIANVLKDFEINQIPPE